jgi:hypothetical protein
VGLPGGSKATPAVVLSLAGCMSDCKGSYRKLSVSAIRRFAISTPHGSRRRLAEHRPAASGNSQPMTTPAALPAILHRSAEFYRNFNAKP